MSSRALAPLPIDAELPKIVGAVAKHRTCVVVAPPGSGKTTRVPGALIDPPPHSPGPGLQHDADREGLYKSGAIGAGVVAGTVVVLQPRRVAARLAATRIAEERGVELGGEVGYHVRFERKASARTRIELVTEGVLSRRLISDPDLRGVGCVVIDEFHERHLDGDLALALVARLRETRPDLALIAMSATLDAEPIAGFLGGAPIVRSEGRTFPVAIEYADQRDDRPLGKQVASQVRRFAQRGLDGDILVFLPGVGEIRRCAEDLEDAARTFRLAVLPLHGDLSIDDQHAAVRPAADGRRKVILATNVAETSLTIDGVTCVIDSGLARVSRHSPWSGVPSLEVEPISQASCAQRAGRAGRTRPGRVVRLFTKHDHDTRRAFDAPEVHRADLTAAVLGLHAANLAGPGALRWFEAPPPHAVQAAEDLLVQLSAVTSAGQLTDLGRRMVKFPVHPRAARLLCEAEARGVAKPACVIAALLGARELRTARRGRGEMARLSSSSDLIDDYDAFCEATRGGLRPDRLRAHGLDVATAFSVDRAAQQLERLVAPTPHSLGGNTPRAGDPGRPSKRSNPGAFDLSPRDVATHDHVDRELQISILTAFPDRVGKRRSPRSPDIVFASGGSGVLAPSSGVIDPELVVAVDAAETSRSPGTSVQIRRASAVDPSWLLDLFFDRVAERQALVWNRERERVEQLTQITYDDLAIDENRDVEGARRSGVAASQLLAAQAIAAGIGRFVDGDALAQWRARVSLVAKVAPELGIAPITDESLATVLAAACEGAISFAELRQLDLLALVDAQLGDRQAAVNRFAPSHLTLPGRKRAPIYYAIDQPPWIASRIQDFFGVSQAPTICDGRVPLVVHLLAPNQRPVQVTADLAGFWVKHYPALRKQLMRRYPRHAWPEDPSSLPT